LETWCSAVLVFSLEAIIGKLRVVIMVTEQDDGGV
jgi:hypothetical protein